MKKALMVLLVASMLLAQPIMAFASGKEEQINLFTSTKGRWFKPEQLEAVKNHLANLDEATLKSALFANYRDPEIMMVWAILGIDRFFLDDIPLGILKIVTGGGTGVWWMIDLFSVKRRTFEYNYKLVTSFR